MTNTKFNILYSENEQALINFANKLTNYSDLSKDLVQETALKAFKSFHSFKPGTSFKSWTFTILKNTFISDYRKRKRRSTHSESIEDITFMLDQSKFAVNDGVSDSAVKDINKCIDELSYKTRLPLMMHMEGFQYNEISETMNIPIGTVKSRINYARKKLQSKLVGLGMREAA